MGEINTATKIPRDDGAMSLALLQDCLSNTALQTLHTEIA